MAMGVGLGTAIIGFFSATGSAAAIAAAGGAALTGMMAVAAGALGGAIIGAAIGGLTAAITGGSIGKGILFGAVGGAVAGGISGAWSGFGTTATTTTNPLASLSQTTVPTASGDIVSLAGGVGESAGGTAGNVVGGALAGLGNSVVPALVTTAGTMVMGAFDTTTEDTLQAQAEQAALQREHEAMNLVDTGSIQTGIARLQADSAERIAGANNETAQRGQDKQWDIANQQIKEGQRQYDTEKALTAAELERRQYAISKAKAAREGVLSGDYKSIDQQVFEQEEEMMYG